MEVPWEQGIRHGEDVNVDNAFRLVCDCVDELEKNGIKSVSYTHLTLPTKRIV